MCNLTGFRVGSVIGCYNQGVYGFFFSLRSRHTLDISLFTEEGSAPMFFQDIEDFDVYYIFILLIDFLHNT